MIFFKRLTFVFLMVIFLSSNASFAQMLVADSGPSCKRGLPVCAPGQRAVCFALYPDVHSVENKHVAICDINRIPICFDVVDQKKSSSDITLECVVRAGKSSPYCPDGMRAKCFGSSNVIPNFELENPCGKTLAVCESENNWTARKVSNAFWE